MTTYTVSYDLNKEKNYPKLLDEIRRLGGHRTQASYWLVAVGNTAKELHDHLKGFIDADDSLWVSELTKNHCRSNALKGTKDFIEKHPPVR